jgi:hypothetical protein
MILQRSVLEDEFGERSSCAWKNPARCALQNPSAWRWNEAVANDLHRAYLSLGSNIEAEAIFPRR